jgi:hypothetical protein
LSGALAGKEKFDGIACKMFLFQRNQMSKKIMRENFPEGLFFVGQIAPADGCRPCHLKAPQRHGFLARGICADGELPSSDGVD